MEELAKLEAERGTRECFGRERIERKRDERESIRIAGKNFFDVAVIMAAYTE